MSDKFRSAFPVAVTFSAGEMPTAPKMSAIATQAKQAANLFEHALGDLWNQAGDSLINVLANALMIPNLARYIGATKETSPRIPYLPDIQDYTWHPHAVNDVGNKEAILTFLPAAGTSYVWTGGASGDPYPGGAARSNESDVTASGDWYIDTDTGRVSFYDPIRSDWTLTYTPDVPGDIGSSATFNVIPDLDTHSSYDFQGVKIEYVNGTDNSQGYYIFLPPRGPLDTRKINRSPQDNVVAPAHSDNFQTSPSSGTRKFWQADTVDADISSNAEHYRYVLPKIITDVWGSASAIPVGLVYLWDTTYSGTLIEGLVFTAESAAVPRKYVLVASGSSLDDYLSNAGATPYPTANLQSTSHAASLYPSTGLRLVTVGVGISYFVSQLMKQFLQHNHAEASSLPGRPIPHSALTGQFSRDADSPMPQLDASALANDDHPQYLHRRGSPLLVTARDKYNNGMFDDLLLLSTSSTNDYQNVTNPSNAIRFGHLSSGPFVNFSTAADGLDVDSLLLNTPTGMDICLQGDSDDGTSRGLYFDPENADGLGLRAVGDNLKLEALGYNIHLQANQIYVECPEIRIYEPTEPYISFDTGAALSIIKNTAAGEFTLIDNAQPVAAQGTSLITNQYFTGSYNDGTYGYSGASSSAGYGPIRTHLLDPNQFRHFSFANPASAPISLPSANPNHGTWASATDIVAGHRAYDIGGGYHEAMTLFLDAQGVSAEHGYLWAYINLPFNQYCIVNVSMSASAVAGTALTDIYCAIGYQIEGATGGTPAGVEVEEVDLSTKFGSAINETYPSSQSIFTVDTIAPLTFTDKTDASPRLPWLRFRSDYNSLTDAVIRSIRVLYRIKEF